MKKTVKVWVLVNPRFVARAHEYKRNLEEDNRMELAAYKEAKVVRGTLTFEVPTKVKRTARTRAH